MKNILVVGGAGYIGTHQVRELCEKNYNVVVLDNLNTGHRDKVDSRATFVEGDVRDLDLVVDLLKSHKIDGVIHFAALSLVGESGEKPLHYYNNNVYGMEILLKAMVETGVKNIVFSSSAATYGEHKIMPIDESYLTNPTSCYGETKLAMEKMIKWASIAHDINYVSLRYFNVAGASLDGSIGEGHDPETHLIPIIIKSELSGNKFKIFGDDYDTPDGTCIRDYIHVVDLVEAHTLSINYLFNGGESEIFNLGYGHGFSVGEIVREVEKVVGKKLNYDIVERRPGDPAKLIGDNKKIVEKLNWKPKYDNIETIIKTAYKWHENN